MIATLSHALFALALATATPHAAAPDTAALATLLGRFLDGAGRNDLATHQRFWADDLIYTGSGGRRIGKSEILREVRETPPSKPDDPVTRYGAEDVRIQQYGDAAMVAFRLVATTTHGDTTQVAHYLNTGFFLKRAGEWRAVGWQATRVPE